MPAKKSKAEYQKTARDKKDRDRWTDAAGKDKAGKFAPEGSDPALTTSELVGKRKAVLPASSVPAVVDRIEDGIVVLEIDGSLLVDVSQALLPFVKEGDKGYLEWYVEKGA